MKRTIIFFFVIMIFCSCKNIPVEVNSYDPINYQPTKIFLNETKYFGQLPDGSEIYIEFAKYDLSGYPVIKYPHCDIPILPDAINKLLLYNKYKIYVELISCNDLCITIRIMPIML